MAAVRRRFARRAAALLVLVLALPPSARAQRAAVAELFDFCRVKGRTPPTLAALNLTMGSMYGTPVCAGDPRFLAAEYAPPGFCLHPELRRGLILRVPTLPNLRGTPLAFDQFASERVLLARWLQEAEMCDLGVPGSCAAEVLVVPSPYLHCEAAHDFSLLGSRVPGQGADHAAYWRHVLGSVSRLQPSVRRVVVHLPFVFIFDDHVPHELSSLPAELRRKVLITSIGPQVPLKKGRNWVGRWAAPYRLSPQQQLRALRAHPPAAAASFPLVLALPYPTGLFSAPVDWLAPSGAFNASERPILLSLDVGTKRRRHLQRKDIVSAIQRAGGVCEGARCRLCRPGHEEACLAVRGLWPLVVRSTFCAEPAGDSPDRSHIYIAIAAGCVPVIFGGLNDGWQTRAAHGVYVPPTRYAWRQEDERAAAEDNALARELDGGKAPLWEAYSDFSVEVDLAATGMAAANGSWVESLRALPAERLHELRVGLRRVAHAMGYRTRADACARAADDCDGFARLRRFVHLSVLLTKRQASSEASAKGAGAKPSPAAGAEGAAGARSRRRGSALPRSVLDRQRRIRRPKLHPQLRLRARRRSRE